MDPNSYKQKVGGFADAAHGEVHSHFKTYFIIWIALLVGTLLTYITGRMDLGRAGLVVALAIASTKAFLVITYFMHMKEARGFTRLVIGVSVWFIFVMLFYVFADLGGRFRGANPQGSAWSDLPPSPVSRGERPLEPPVPVETGHRP